MMKGSYITPRTNECSEGETYAKNRGRPRKRSGRKKKVSAMVTGRYPFSTAANRYLTKRRGMLAESTWKNTERAYRFLDGVFSELKDQGRVSTVNPERFTKDDISEFLAWMKQRTLESETQAKYLHYIDKLCLFCRNPVVQELRQDGENLPRRVRKDLFSLEPDRLNRIQEAAERIPGWRGAITRLMVWVYPWTGLRPSELRRAYVEDLDIREWKFQVRHPKGEGSWGKKRSVPILSPARPAVLRFLRERKMHLESMGREESVALIPNVNGGADETYSSNAFREMKKTVESMAGVKFKLKDFRPTFAQMCIDKDPSLLPAVSRILGHESTRTTEEYYARMRECDAFRQLENAWRERTPVETGYTFNPAWPPSRGPKNIFIEQDKYMSGYA